MLSYLSMAIDRYGYDNKKLSLLLNHRIKPQPGALDPVSHQFKILEQAGVSLKDNYLELWPHPDDFKSVDDLLSREWLSPGERLIGINAGSSPRWITKSLSTPLLIKLCDELGRLKKIRVVLTGTRVDFERAHAIAQSVKTVKVINACSRTTVNQLACLIKKCGVYITCDSAPLHIAAAVGTPFVALFGPTDPRRHMPPAKKHILINKQLSCSPCYKSKCDKRACMESIKPQEIVEAVKQLLE